MAEEDSSIGFEWCADLAVFCRLVGADLPAEEGRFAGVLDDFASSSSSSEELACSFDGS